MNVLLVGGASAFMNRLIQKMKKEGHRVCLLTGNRFKDDSYDRVFESYRFSYDSESVGKVFESVAPDVTVFLGAYDTNFHWNEEQRNMPSRFMMSLISLLMAFRSVGKGRFICLSSEEVYGGDHPRDITEKEEPRPETEKGIALAQGEKLCEAFGKMKEQDVVVLRLQHLYGIPARRADCTETVTWLCLEALRGNELSGDGKLKEALLFDADAVEHIYQVASCQGHRSWLYNLSSSVEISQLELAGWVGAAIGVTESPAAVAQNPPGRRRVLSNQRFTQEFHAVQRGETRGNVEKVAAYMKDHQDVFLTEMERTPTFWEKFKRGAGWFISSLIPFLEALICFIPAYLLNSWAANSGYFSRLDIYLLYVLLFSIVHGQHQALFSALLATVGYFLQQSSLRGGFEVAVDYNTYVWIAQLFIVGLLVGYLRDQIQSLKEEAADEQEYLSDQLTDIRSINASNVRVKDALTTQILNQNDSIGKVYYVTSALNQVMPEEVLFRAAQMLGELMDSRDVAVYTVSNRDYARLFSYTSPLAKKAGGSIRYREMGKLSEALENQKVFINRELDAGYPMMASAIYSDDEMQTIVMVWSLPWERMTLGQADYLVVCGYLIQNAVVHANRYLSSLRDSRYVEDGELLSQEAFRALAGSFLRAQADGLTECTLLEVDAKGKTTAELGRAVRTGLRANDYTGTLDGKRVCALLTNTTPEQAAIVIGRFEEKGYQCRIREDSGL